MNITIHRGSCEIGGSCIEIEGQGGSQILLDIGKPLAEGGVALRMPSQLDGVLISHAHQDHYGLLEKVAPHIPVWLGAPTKRLMEVTGQFTGQNFHVANPQIFQSFKMFACGEFQITPYLVDHSAFDAHGFLIEDGRTRLFYSGDFRGHGRKAVLLERLEEYPVPAVDVLLLEGTTIGRKDEDIVTEDDLEERIAKRLKASESLALTCVSGQNIDRLVTLFRACCRAGRTLVVDPYTGYVLREMNAFSPRIPFPSPGYSRHLRVFYPRQLCRRMRLHLELGDILDEFNRYRVYPHNMIRYPQRYLVLVRDTMAVELARKMGESARAALFFYSFWRGYWQESGMVNLRAWVEEMQMQHIYAHTSGHACPADLRRLADALRPGRIIPVHTNAPNLYKDCLTQPVQLAQDGIPIVI